MPTHFLKICILGFIIIYFSTVSIAQRTITINGVIREKNSKEVLIGAGIATSDFLKTTLSNNYGVYALSLPYSKDSIELQFSFVGFRLKTLKISGNTNVSRDVELDPLTETLQTVEIKAQQPFLTNGNSGLSSIVLPIKIIKDLPALLGEKDPLKILQLLPGVSNPREGFSGIYVRGGDPGQNLFLLDDAIVYNAYHLFGFFSVFNGDALRHVELFKGGFPARYGGRASAVLDLRMKDGNKESFHGEGGIGLISSRLTLEGPIVKNKLSFVVSGRRTYADLLIKPLLDKNTDLSIFFYDLNAKLNWQLSDRDNISLSSYLGKDNFNNTDITAAKTQTDGFNWGNSTVVLKWNRIISNKLFSNVALTFSDFKFRVNSESVQSDTLTSLAYYSGIRDYAVKWDLDYNVSSNFKIQTGIHVFSHQFTTSAYVTIDPRLNINFTSVAPINALESGAYLENVYQPTKNIYLNVGIRFAQFAVKNKNYWRAEPRLNARFNLSENTSLQTSYSRMNQFLHLLSNSSASLPTDLWIPATDKIAPQQTDQFTLGVSHMLKEGNIKISSEGYYKNFNQLIGYKDGASFLIANAGPDPKAYKQVSFEDNVTTGKGYSFGLETLIQYQGKKFQSWLSYTLSWTKQQLDGVNNDAYYFARQDKRHNLSLVSTYNLSKKWKFSATWVYSTGSAVTIPVSNFTASVYDTYSGAFNNFQATQEYSAKNAFRLPDYHRLDISFQYHKIKKWGEAYWEFGVYNVYNRANPFYLTSGKDPNDAQKVVVYKIALFPAIPSISYNFKF